MQWFYCALAVRLALAGAVSFTLQPGASWEAAEGPLKELSALLAAVATKSDEAAAEASAHKMTDHSKTPWTWYDLDIDFLNTIKDLKPGRALDLGSGAGTQSIALAKLGWEVVGIEHAADAVEYAQGEAKAAGVEVKFLKADLMRPTEFLALPGLGRGSFDLIIDRGCLHAVQGLETSLVPELYFFYVKYLLKPQGLHLLKVLHRRVIAGVADLILKNLRLLRYQQSQEAVQAIFRMSMFWLLPSFAFNPMRPFFLTPEEQEALVSKHLVDVAVDGDAVMQTVMNGTGFGKALGLELPTDVIFSVARNPEGPLHFAAEPAAGPEAGLHHMNQFATPKQLLQLKQMREAGPPPGMPMGPGGPGGPGKMPGKTIPENKAPGKSRKEL